MITDAFVSEFNNNSALLHSIGDITSILTLVPLIIFVWLSIRSKSFKGFQFQISIFIVLYIIGQIIENNTNRISAFSVLPEDIGSQIHVIAAIFFAIMVWFRFYYVEVSGKKMIESPESDNI